MNELVWDLDELVAKVMEDLRRNSTATSAGEITSSALTHDFRSLHSKQSTESDLDYSAKNKSDVLIVTERVIVVDVVSRLAKCSSAKVWQVLPRAIVTPAAKDELRRLGVTLTSGQADSVGILASEKNENRRATVSSSNVGVHGDLSSNSISRPKKVGGGVIPRVLIASHLPETERFPETVREYLSRNAETSELHLACLKEISQNIANELEKNSALKVILATHDAAIGCIWANRLAGVRAVVAYTFEQAKRDVVATNANVVILDPYAVGPYPFRLIVDNFIRS